MINLNLRHRCYSFSTSGKIVYDPDRKKMKNRTTHWAVIEVDDEIANYYRSMFYDHFNIQLVKPSWETHLSVLKGYNNTDTSIPWGFKDGDIVQVEYNNELFWDENHVWLNAHSDSIFEIREHYGIFSALDSGHITIGKFHLSDVGKINPFKSYKI